MSVVSPFFTINNNMCCYNSLKDRPAMRKRYIQKLMAEDGSDEDSSAGSLTNFSFVGKYKTISRYYSTVA